MKEFVMRILLVETIITLLGLIFMFTGLVGEVFNKYNNWTWTHCVPVVGTGLFLILITVYTLFIIS